MSDPSGRSVGEAASALDGPVVGIVLAAGHGTRMRSAHPKVLFPLLGRPLLEYPLRALERLGCDATVAVIGSAADRVRAAFAERGLLWALQDPPRGTGDATRLGLEALADAGDLGTVVVLNGDLPLLEAETLAELVAAHRAAAASLTLLVLRRDDPRGYGRIVRDGAGDVVAVVEEADADAAQRAIGEVNGGVYVAEGAALLAALRRLDGERLANAQGELYLPPAIGPVREAGGRVVTWTLPPARADELQQVNDRVELAAATALRGAAVIRAHQLRGVTVVDPSTTVIEEDVEIGQDTVIHPFSLIRAGIHIGARCEVGPFAHLRLGTELADEAEIGNFTEVKNTRMGRGSKAKHLSYLGDGEVGERVNIGAGTIFANYDGEKKSATTIGDGAFVGSGTIFVAPVTMGARARTGAGAVVVRGRDIAAGETVVGVPARPLQREE